MFKTINFWISIIISTIVGYFIPSFIECPQCFLVCVLVGATIGFIAMSLPHIEVKDLW